MILSNKVIFILGIAKFDGPFESTSYTVAKYLSKDNRVYYIDYPYTWKDFFLKRNEAFAKRAPYFSRNSDGIIDTDSSNLKIVIVPPLMSINFLKEGGLYRFLLTFNEKIILKRILKIIKKFNIKDYLFINSFNFHYPNIGRILEPEIYAYHCVDPLIGDHDTRHGLVSEQIIIDECDVVVCTSKQLFSEKKKINENTFFIPNAADIEHSSKAMQTAVLVHQALAMIPSPIVGYFGNIERRIDFQLLDKVVRSAPQISFVFAGPVDHKYIPESFKELLNVHFIGRIAYEEMPSVLKGFDVAMIPFKRDEVSRTIFPLKLFEYLGAGKPVVSTDFNLDLSEFTGDAIKYTSTAEDFGKQINEAIYNDSETKRNKRLKIASENSWDRRLKEFSELIYSYSIRRK